MRHRLIGVLGGMGPLATVDFMRKVIESTPAVHDQDHVPMIVYSVPQIPDRVSAILEGRDDPLPYLIAGVRTLERAGAELIVMPCNTAHAWFPQMAASVGVPILHMAEAVQQKFHEMAEPPKKIALMATRGTLHTRIYQKALSGPGCEVMLPREEIQIVIGKAVAAVKRNDFATATAQATLAGEHLLSEGANTLLLACTELPLAFEASPLQHKVLDATQCLAEATIAFSLGQTKDFRSSPAASRRAM